MAMATTYAPLPEAEHSAQLRKAVIASTIGTAIEWYDFFLYGTAAGLVFGKLYFPNAGPASRATLARLRHLFHRLCRPAGRRGDFRPLRRSHRPQGYADRHAAVHGHCDLPGRLRADLRVDRHLGRGDPDRLARAARHRRRRGMGRLGAPGDGMVAHPRPARPGRLMAAIRRPLRAVSVESGGARLQRLGGRPVPGLGLAHSLRAFDHSRRRRACGFASAFSRPRCSRSSWTTNKIEKAPIAEVFKKQPREIILSALLRVSEQAPFYIFTAFIFAYAVGTLKMERNFILGAVMVAACVSFITIPLSGHISDRIGRKRMYLIGVVAIGLFGFLYFGMVDTAIPSAVFIAIVLSLIPHDIQYGPQAALIAESFTPRLRYSGASLGYQLASIIAGGPAPIIATALFTHYQLRLRDRDLHCRLRRRSALVAAALMPDYTGKDISRVYTTSPDPRLLTALCPQINMKWPRFRERALLVPMPTGGRRVARRRRPAACLPSPGSSMNSSRTVETQPSGHAAGRRGRSICSSGFWCSWRWPPASRSARFHPEPVCGWRHSATPSSRRSAC